MVDPGDLIMMMFENFLRHCNCLDASVVHISGTRQLQANQPVLGPRLSPRQFT